MKHMFAGNAWSTPKTGGVQGMGFRPGPVQVTVQPGHFQLGSSQPSRPLPFKSIGASQQHQMDGECADGSCSLPQPSNVQPNAVPMGKKTDCPVCRTFGSGGGRSGF